MRKEYNDRWNAPLVHPPVTHGEWENMKELDSVFISEIKKDKKNEE